MSRGKCVSEIPLTRTSTGGNRHWLDYRHVCCHLQETLTGWLRLCHTLTVKFRRIAPASFFLYGCCWRDGACSACGCWALLIPHSGKQETQRAHSDTTAAPSLPCQHPHAPEQLLQPLLPASGSWRLHREFPGSVSTLVSFGWQRTEPHGCLSPKQGHQPWSPLQLPSKGQTLENAPSRNNCSISLPWTFCAFLCPSYWGNSYEKSSSVSTKVNHKFENQRS